MWDVWKRMLKALPRGSRSLRVFVECAVVLVVVGLAGGWFTGTSGSSAAPASTTSTAAGASAAPPSHRQCATGTEAPAPAAPPQRAPLLNLPSKWSVNAEAPFDGTHFVLSAEVTVAIRGVLAETRCVEPILTLLHKNDIVRISDAVVSNPFTSPGLFDVYRRYVSIHDALLGVPKGSKGGLVLSTQEWTVTQVPALDTTTLVDDGSLKATPHVVLKVQRLLHVKLDTTLASGSCQSPGPVWIDYTVLRGALVDVKSGVRSVKRSDLHPVVAGGLWNQGTC